MVLTLMLLLPVPTFSYSAGTQRNLVVRKYGSAIYVQQFESHSEIVREPTREQNAEFLPR